VGLERVPQQSPVMEPTTTYTWQDVCAERSRRQKAIRIQKKVGSILFFAAACKAQLNATDLAGAAQVSRWRRVWPVWS